MDQSNGDLYVGDDSGVRSGATAATAAPSAAPITDADYAGGITPPDLPCDVAADGGHVYAADWASAAARSHRYGASDFTASPSSPAGTLIDPTAVASPSTPQAATSTSTTATRSTP